VLKAYLKGWFDSDPSSAIDFAIANQNRANFTRGIGAVGKRLLAVSPDAATEFVNRLDESTRLGALMTLVMPEDYDYSPVPGQPNKHEIADVEPAPTPKPEAMVSWLLQFSPEESQPAITQMLRQWETGGLSEIVTWMGELPSMDRSRVVDAFADTIDIAPAKAIEWVAGLSDMRLRDEMLEALIPRVAYARDDVLETLQRIPLSASQKTHLASLMPDPEPADQVQSTNPP
jgi:hypothetical protein